MEKLSSEIRAIIEQLAKTFGINSWLTLEEENRMRTFFLAGRAECVNLVKDRFGLKDVKVDAYFLKPRGLKDRFRFLWPDIAYECMRGMADLPRIQNYSNPISLFRFRQENDAGGVEVSAVDLCMKPWVKRLPFEVFVYLVARCMSRIWLNKVDYRLRGYQASEEILMLLAGLNHFINYGRKVGRYYFGILDTGDINRTWNFIRRRGWEQSRAE